MIKFNRKQLKNEFPELIALIQKNHIMEDNIERELYIDNKPVVGLCHTRGYFVIFDGYYIQYTMDHIITNVELKLIGRSVQDVTFYDNYIEYETDRTKAMSATKDQTGINLN